MSYQIQIQKDLTQTDFLTTTVYEKYDLTNTINPGDKFMVRQGDLIITNYRIDQYRKRGLREALVFSGGGVHIFGMSHVILAESEKTLLVHPEHGVIVIPRPFHSLRFYTFNEAGD